MWSGMASDTCYDLVLLILLLLLSAGVARINCHTCLYGAQIFAYEVILLTDSQLRWQQKIIMYIKLRNF